LSASRREERVFLVEVDCEDSRGSGDLRGGWFREGISKKVGDEADTFFLDQSLVGCDFLDGEV
jgi:hypothetical protein